MFNDGNQKSAEIMAAARPAAAGRSAHRPQNLAPTGSFWRRFQEWERADRHDLARPMSVAC